MEISGIAGLPKQTTSQTLMPVPGVIWIENERIEYFQRNGTTIKYIRRGTGGTSSGIPSVYDGSGDLISDFSDANIGDVIYPAGTIVTDRTQKQAIPGGYEWEAAPAGLQASNSTQATFLKDKPGSL